jgi:hypothetical protein
LVNHGDTWHYHKGTNEPQADWSTAADASLDPSWLTGPGGFGFGDGDDATVLSDMRSNYFTVYIRKSFTNDSAVDTNRHLLLTMDYDDGFIAYLDGTEIARSSNVLGAAGTMHPHNQGLPTDHEARRYQNLPAELFDLGPVGDRLAPDAHVLALQGINGTVDSSDVSLIADLSLGGTGASIVSGPLLSIVPSDSVPLSGTNTLPGTTRVLVDGAEASFSQDLGTWSHTVSLRPGCNRVLLQAVDDTGMPRYSTNVAIISELTSTSVGGPLTGNVTWDGAMGVIRLTNSVTVRPGGTLNINPGAVVLLGAGQSIRATNNATILVSGMEGDLPCLGPADGRSTWGEIAADGENSVLTLRYLETIGGAVKFRNGATGLMEDCYIHDFKSGSTPIGGCTRAASVTVRRCIFRIYHETLWQLTPMLVEESLFELANNPSSDGLDFDGAPPGSTIRRCTFRHGPNDNTDAIDIGPGQGVGSVGVVIEDCVMTGFPTDKGVSIGEGSYGIVVRNCLMYENESGVAVKDTPADPSRPCTAIVYNCTIVENLFGFTNFNKSCLTCPTGGGQTTNSFNNILWGNRTTLSLINSGTLTADHSNFQGTNYPGLGNISIDPLFLDPAERDYRLRPDSPCLGTGRDGASMGAHFPVGAAMALSHPKIDSIERRPASGNEGIHDVIRFWADSERSYTLLGTDTLPATNWEKVADVLPQMLPRRVTLTNAVTANSKRFYQLVSPRQP